MVISFNTKGMPELKELLDRMKGAGREAALDGIHDWLDFTAEVAEGIVPEGKTGNLARTQKVIKTQDGGSIVYDANYAAAVHFGYVQHPVAPVRRKALHWKINGKDFFSKGHDVPKKTKRSKPNPWLFNAVNNSMQYLKDFILDAYEKKIGG